MNPDLERLQPYPFERLRLLLAGCTPPADLPPVNLSIGEPRHETPKLVREALTASLAGLANYPATAGAPELREAIGAWLARRFRLKRIDPAAQVLPVLGTREALFAIAQTVIDRSRPARVVAPNPFYQIYEGAALLAGAEPLFLPTTEANGLRMEFEGVTPQAWRSVQLVYVCTPGNPTGRVMTLDEWRVLFDLSDRYGFVIAADECYSEIYCTEGEAPLGGLEAAQTLGRDDYANLLSFGSLSKRSNAPGLRSGYVAGDAAIVRKFLLYRTYHGNAMSPPVQVASIAAWSDETHVIENRRRYAEKFARVTPIVAPVLPTRRPEAGFYLWARTPIDDALYAQRLFAACNVTVLPGSFLGRERNGVNPGAGHVRIALVAGADEAVAAARRIAAFANTL